jgi:hypothetical protein
MAGTLSDGRLSFSGTVSGGTITPTSAFLHSSTASNVFDNGTGVGDDNADTATDYYVNPGVPYTGYTININGNDYAIFQSVNGYEVPYFNSVEDLSSLNATAVTQTITQTGENAVVVNLCFLGGTQIATPDGERLVEDLAIGDHVRTADGRDVVVKWIGRQLVKPAAVNLPLDERLTPVCITAGTLGNHSDLYVTADHGMIVSPSNSDAAGKHSVGEPLKDGLVINASALVNGDTVRFVPVSEMPTEFTYYHIETEDHDVILANGAPSETFIDVAGRSVFDNYDEYIALYGVERIIPEMRKHRISTQRLLPDAIKARLASTAPDRVNVLQKTG